jgi:hypothetical protein
MDDLLISTISADVLLSLIIPMFAKRPRRRAVIRLHLSLLKFPRTFIGLHSRSCSFSYELATEFPIVDVTPCVEMLCFLAPELESFCKTGNAILCRLGLALSAVLGSGRRDARLGLSALFSSESPLHWTNPACWDRPIRSGMADSTLRGDRQAKATANDNLFRLIYFVVMKLCCARITLKVTYIILDDDEVCSRQLPMA